MDIQNLSDMYQELKNQYPLSSDTDIAGLLCVSGTYYSFACAVVAYTAPGNFYDLI